MKNVLIKLLSLISLFALIASACGSDGDDAAGEQTGGQVTIAEGTVLDLDACPDDWNSSEGTTWNFSTSVWTTCSFWNYRNWHAVLL